MSETASRKHRSLKRWCNIRLAVEVLEDRCVPSAASGIHLLGTPNDPGFSSLWGMSKINAPTAWDTSTGSTNVIVANIDTGIDYTHPDLYLNIWINQGEIPEDVKALFPHQVITFHTLNQRDAGGALVYGQFDSDGNGRIDGGDVLSLWSDGVNSDGNGYVDDLVGWNFVANNNNPFDDNSHGTHTAGTIGAIGNNELGVVGVNWQVQIMALKILDENGGAATLDEALTDATAAVYYAAQNGAKVSNNSWGFYDSGETKTGSRYSNLYQAIQNTPQVLFVAAAGNNGLNNDTHWAATYPATYNLDNIVSVAATSSNDQKPYWSNYGATTVDLGAPGQAVWSTVPGGYASYSGTSMATPHVAGAAALLLSVKPTATAAEVKAAIINSVDRVKSMVDRTVSDGRLNLAKAVAAIQGEPPPGDGGGGGGGGKPGKGNGQGGASRQTIGGDLDSPFADSVGAATDADRLTFVDVPVFTASASAMTFAFPPPQMSAQASFQTAAPGRFTPSVAADSGGMTMAVVDDAAPPWGFGLSSPRLNAGNSVASDVPVADWGRAVSRSHSVGSEMWAWAPASSAHAPAAPEDHGPLVPAFDKRAGLLGALGLLAYAASLQSDRTSTAAALILPRHAGK